MGGNNKLFSIILISLLGLSALLTILFFVGTVSEGLLITWCYVLLGVAVAVAIGFSVIGMAQNPKNAKNALIGIVVLALISGVAYVMSGNELHTNGDGDVLADAVTSQISEGGLIAFYILAAIAIGTVLFAEVSKAFK
jgi:prepilin signal peptidase PulO-like enzyme (type II secretory pathway)